MAPSRDVILRELPTADVIRPGSGTALCTEATWAVPPAPTLRRLFVCCPDQSGSVLHQAPNPAPSGAESLSLSLSLPVSLALATGVIHHIAGGKHGISVSFLF